MVRTRRTNPNARQAVLHRVQRNRRSRRLPHTVITLDNDIIIPTPEIIDLEPQSSEPQNSPYYPRTGNCRNPGKHRRHYHLNTTISG